MLYYSVFYLKYVFMILLVSLELLLVFVILNIVMGEFLKESHIVKTILSLITLQKVTKNTVTKNFSGLAQSKLYHRILFGNRIFKYIILCNIILLHIYFQLDLIDSPYSFYFNWFNFIFNVSGCMLLCIKFITNREVNQGYRLDVYKDIKMFMAQLLLTLIMPYPFTNNVYIELQTKLGILSPYKLNYCFVLFCIIRNTANCSVLLIYNMYTSPQANRIWIIFAMRSVFKDQPFLFMIVIFLLSLFTFASLFRVTQYQIYEDQFEFSNLNTYANMFYMTVITMTSVGYGDMTPQSSLGRLIGTICVSWGVLIVSIMVVVLINAFRMDRNEAQSLNILKRIQNTAHIRNIAGEYIRLSLWRIWKNYKLKLNKQQNLSQRKLMIRFRMQRRLRDIQLISQYQIDFYKEMMRHFQRAFINIQNLSQNNLMIIDYLHQRYIFNE